MLLEDQFCSAVHVWPSDTHHLNWCGAVPPETEAVNVIGVPTACGAGRFAVRLVRVSGVCGAALIANGRLRVEFAFSAASVELAAFRAHTVT